MAVSFGLLVLATVAVGTVSALTIDALHEDLGVATRGYRQLRQLYDVGFYASRARTAADAAPPDWPAATAAVRSATAALDARGHDDPADADGPPAAWVDESARAECHRLLVATPVPFDRLFAKLSSVQAHVRRTTAEAERAANGRRRAAVQTVAGVCAAAAVAAVLIGITQYRRVVGPVRRLAEGARRFAAGQLDEPIATTGDAELAGLAGDFNRMAADLRAIHRDLEERVRTAGRELARAERLASVGYLAAGVAHEINNPLGIIAGYGERALRQLAHANGPPDAERLRSALTVMCDEAFRCKRITDGLLSLARPGAAARGPVSLAAVAADVARAVAALPPSAGRAVTVTGSSAGHVVANADELRQVVLNLVVNAVEATAPGGRVTIDVADGQLMVTDDGRGLSADEIGRAFEPFYTTKRAEGRGTGLGLSIAQAIVSDHGGTLTAASDGVGRGSTFTLRLPAADG